MKKLLIAVLCIGLIVACSKQEEQATISPQKKAALAKRIGSTNLEPWGGITLNTIKVYDPNQQKMVIDHYEGVWAGLTLRFGNVSYEYPPRADVYTHAFGDIINSEELAQSSVAVLGSSVSGYFSLQQMHVANDTYGPSPDARANISIESTIHSVQWFPDPTQYYENPNGIYDAIVDALDKLKDAIKDQQDAAEQDAEIDRITAKIEAHNTDDQTILMDYDDYSYLIMGVLVRKPNGDMGIVPSTWIPPNTSLPEP